MDQGCVALRGPGATVIITRCDVTCSNYPGSNCGSGSEAASWSSWITRECARPVTVTAATGSFIYGMLNAGDTGWADLGTLPPIAAGASLMLVAAGVLIAGLFPGSQHLQRSRFLALRVRPAGMTPRRQAAARAGGARWELPVPGGMRTRRLRMRARATTATAWGAPP